MTVAPLSIRDAARLPRAPVASFGGGVVAGAAVDGGVVHWVAHHGLMLLAMIPCLVPGLLDNPAFAMPVLHAASVPMMLALCVHSTLRARRNVACLPVLLDDLAMLALVIAGLFDRHGAARAEPGGHHGAGGELGMSEGVALAAAAFWLACRVGTWHGLPRGAGDVASAALAGVMVAAMVGGSLSA